MKDKIIPFKCSGKWTGFLQGHVKSARITSYSVKYVEGLPIKIVRQHYVETFDRAGRHLKTLEFDPNGNLVGEELYHYSEDGLLLEVIFTKKGKVTLHDIHEYNDNHQRVRITSYGEDNELRGHSIFKYDEKGNLVEESWNSRTPEHCWKWMHTYDENGNCINSKNFKGSSCRFSHEVCKTYNEDGIQTDHFVKNADGTIDPKEEPQRDENGNVIHKKSTRYTLESEYRYDSSNNLIEMKIFDFIGERYVKNTLKYFYSFDHSTERAITLDRDGNVESVTESRYDANHNLLVSISYKGESNIITNISEHEYVYYSYKDLTGRRLSLFGDDM